MRRSYRSLAQSLGIDYCRGITDKGFYCRKFDHAIGSSERGTIHFADARISWPGIHRFLKLAALATNPDIDKEVPWRRIYLMNMASRRFAEQLHMRVPAKYLQFDRKFVLAGVAGIPNSEPLRKAAYDWARR